MKGNSKKLVILGYVWPEPESSAAGHRAMTLLRIFKDAGYDVVFASSCRENEASRRLSMSEYRHQPIQANDSSFDRWIREEDPATVLFDRFLTEEHFGARVRESIPEAARVLDTVDLHFLRRAREEALSKGAPLESIFSASPALFQPAWESDDALRELASIHRSDLALLCSSFERDLLVGSFGVPEERCGIFPLCYSRDELDAGTAPPFESRSGFSMIGNFRHRPNADAARWFASEIWPLIRAELPGAEARLYGAYPSKEMMDLSRPREGLHVLGPAPTAREAFAPHRVSLAPLRFGAGQKGKVSESWLAGTPVAATPIASEGMASSDGSFGGLVARDARSFAQAAIRLHEDKAEWERAARSGRERLASSFSLDREAPALVSALERLVEGLEGVRSRNWAGAMLAHHQHASTKYFSRWIEAKNSARLVSPLQNPEA